MVKIINIKSNTHTEDEIKIMIDELGSGNNVFLHNSDVRVEIIDVDNMKKFKSRWLKWLL